MQAQNKMAALTPDQSGLILLDHNYYGLITIVGVRPGPVTRPTVDGTPKFHNCCRY